MPAIKEWKKGRQNLLAGNQQPPELAKQRKRIISTEAGLTLSPGIKAA
jgi:hypothetical protein